MTLSTPHSFVLVRKGSPAAAVLTAVAISLFAARVPSQGQDQPPAFEVTSVKPAHGGPVKIQSDPGRLTISDESIEVLIEVAFSLREYQYQGPDWLHTARYDNRRNDGLASAPLGTTRDAAHPAHRSLQADDSPRVENPSDLRPR